MFRTLLLFFDLFFLNQFFILFSPLFPLGHVHLSVVEYHCDHHQYVDDPVPLGTEVGRQGPPKGHGLQLYSQFQTSSTT